VRALYGANAEEVLKLYTASTRDEVISAATDLASDRFIAYSTWKWAELHAKTGGGSAVYQYLYARPRPAMRPEMGNATAGLAGGVIRTQTPQPPPPPARGAVHSAEIEYALGNLSTNNVYAWTDDDYKVSKTMQEFFANFIKRGNPNGPGLPKWPAHNPGTDSDHPSYFMRIDVDSHAEIDTRGARYALLERLSAKH